MTSQRVAVIIGSTRPHRIGPHIADWVVAEVGAGNDLDYEVIDLADMGLPFLDEPRMPALGDYAHAHTRAWSALVLSFDAFIFVFPQYNWGYPGVLKNAVDFLYTEWRGKPATMVTYGTRGGNKSAAAFRTVLGGLHMTALDQTLELALPDADKDADGQLLDIEATLAPYREPARELGAALVAALAERRPLSG